MHGRGREPPSWTVRRVFATGSSVALDFPVSAFVSPKPDQLSDFAKIDEKAFATRWEETLAGRGQAYVSDTSLVSRVVSSAYAKQAAAAVEAERKAAEAAAAAEEAGEEAVAELDADSAQAEAAAASAATKADEARAAKERAAAAQKAAEVPPDALVASLAKETLLQPGSIRS